MATGSATGRGGAAPRPSPLPLLAAPPLPTPLPMPRPLARTRRASSPAATEADTARFCAAPAVGLVSVTTSKLSIFTLTLEPLVKRHTHRSVSLLKALRVPFCPFKSGLFAKPLSCTSTPGAGLAALTSPAAELEVPVPAAMVLSRASSRAASRPPAPNKSSSTPGAGPPLTLPRRRIRLKAGGCATAAAAASAATASCSWASKAAMAARTSRTCLYLFPSGSTNSFLSVFPLFTHSRRQPAGSTIGAGSFLPMSSLSTSLASLSERLPSPASSPKSSARCAKISRSTAKLRIADKAGANSSVRSVSCRRASSSADSTLNCSDESCTDSAL
mmetsp:Transcript_29805/g.65145  ORF Transcript_29805/g.65145 Transcript_29805/m.65145 type:complete len:331 (-) Transcript_29805:120-1112(-)